MARSKETLESRILAYFRSSELGAAQLLFGLVAGEMRARTPKAVAKKKAVKKVEPPKDSIGE